jgi:ectoine hydroxylase-related dioxygenase (phytanoyl-CoA dioxygenase family)
MYSNKEILNIFDSDKGYTVYDLPDEFFLWVAKTIGKKLAGDNSIFLNRDITKDNSVISKLENIETLCRDVRTVEREVVENASENLLNLLGEVMLKPSSFYLNDLYFRLVRSSNESEISVPHRDYYFHKITPDWEHDHKLIDIKLWIPLLLTSPYAIGVVPGSHMEKIHSVKFYNENGQQKFVAEHCQGSLQPVKVSIGQGLIFPNNLIHGSLPKYKRGSLRCSAEFTLCYHVR